MFLSDKQLLFKSPSGVYDFSIYNDTEDIKFNYQNTTSNMFLESFRLNKETGLLTFNNNIVSPNINGMTLNIALL